MIPIAAVSALYQLGYELADNGARDRRRDRARPRGLALMMLERQGNFRTAKLERGDPLPRGRYWIDVFSNAQMAWDVWLMGAGPRVHVISTESFEGDPDYGNLSRNWYLFEVVEPVPWNRIAAPGLGYPTIAGKDVKSSEDTVQKPGPSSFFPEDWSPTTKIFVGGTALIVGAAVVGYAVRSFR